MTVLSSQNEAARALYSALLDQMPSRNDLPRLVIVQHVVPNTIPFFQVLADKFDIAAIIPKPNSIDMSALDYLEAASEKYPMKPLKRGQIESSHNTLAILGLPSDGRKVVVLDVGGYFARPAETDEKFIEILSGIVEDTENGHARYAELLKRAKKLPCPLYTVARSPLKESEDFLVGQSISHSAERIIREDNSLLLNKRVLVIGYGKLGKSISSSLSARNIAVSIYDSDPVKRAQALSHGFFAPGRADAIKSADLIFGATGNKSLTMQDLPNLKHHCYVVSVTSADDEFDLAEGLKNLSRTGVDDLAAYHSNGKTVYFLAGGNAVNFAHRNSLGPYIYLVASEIIMSLRRIVEGGTAGAGNRLQELPVADRRHVATLWLEKFGDHPRA